MAFLQPLATRTWRRSRLVSLGLTATVLGSGGAYGQTVPAGIVAETANTTNTTILLDPQNPSVAVISNGLQSGDNLYHRFSQFDTTKSQDQLSRVLFDLANSSRIQNLVVGVSATQGSLISVPIVLSQSANLLFLSPFGIVMSGAAGFGVGTATSAISPLARVAITTANQLDFTNNSTNASSFEVVPTTSSPTKGYPNGAPNPQITGQSSLANVYGQVILDGQTRGPVSLVVDQALMVAELVPTGIPESPLTLAPVQVKGQVTLGIAGTGTIYGRFDLGEWSNNAWSTANLIATSGSGALDWTAPVAVKPGSEFKLQASGNGAITLQGLVSLYGWETTNALTFATLASSSGDHTVAGGIELLGPGRIEVQSGSLQINATPNNNSTISANYSYNEPTNNWGAINDAYNLLFDIAPEAVATVNGAIILGEGGLTKLGDGTLTLNSLNNAYTGPTNVLGGYLEVNGATPETASCSNGGDSNRCGALASDGDWYADYESYDDGELGYEMDDADSDTMDAMDAMAMDEDSSFDIDSGEGSLLAPGLDIDLAVNDSFAIADNGEQGPTNATPGPGAAGLAQGSPEPVVSALGSQEAGVALSRSDNQATLSALQSLAPERLAGGIPATPTPQQLQLEMQRQVQQIRSGAGGLPSGQLRSQGGDQSSWIASTSLLAAGPALPSFQRSSYQPAVVHLRFSEERPSPAAAARSKATDAFLDITLIPLDGPVEGRRVEVSKKLFLDQLRDLYSRLSRQESLDTANPKAAARQLFNQLIGPIIAQLQAKGVTTLLIAADRGLQAIPFAALHDGSKYFGDRYSFSITPSLALTNLSTPESVDKVLLLAGASKFEGLAPLPLVPQELREIGAKSSASIFLNRDFTPEVLLEKAADPRYSRIHIATHAEFLPGGPSSSYLYSGVGPIPLTAFNRLRLQRKGAPLDLITFSACRTALGDPNSELGFAGLAVQAGARSAAGTLWYVDDVASSAYFQQMYRYLDQGVPKAEALQLTRQAFLRGYVHLEGDRLHGPNGSILLTNLTKEQQRRVKDGLKNPYFWAGVELIGSPW